MARAERFCEALRALRISAGDSVLRVSASFGVACADDVHQPGLEALIAEADAALYESKAAGRDRVVVSPPPAH